MIVCRRQLFGADFLCLFFFRRGTLCSCSFRRSHVCQMECLRLSWRVNALYRIECNLLATLGVAVCLKWVEVDLMLWTYVYTSLQPVCYLPYCCLNCRRSDTRLLYCLLRLYLYNARVYNFIDVVSHLFVFALNVPAVCVLILCDCTVQCISLLL